MNDGPTISDKERSTIVPLRELFLAPSDQATNRPVSFIAAIKSAHQRLIFGGRATLGGVKPELIYFE